MDSNSNKYVRNALDNLNWFGGSKWKNISLQEIILFHGILLKMNLDYCHIGSYDLYFNSLEEIKYLTPFPFHYMDFPNGQNMSCPQGDSNKSEQHIIQKLVHWQYLTYVNVFNNVAKKAFTPGAHMAFDERGFGCLSSLCPVRV